MLRLCLLVCVLLCLSRGVGDFDVPAIIYRNMAWNRSQREPAAAAAVNFGGGSQINFKVLFDETNAPLETRRAHDGWHCIVICLVVVSISTYMCLTEVYRGDKAVSFQLEKNKQKNNIKWWAWLNQSLCLSELFIPGVKSCSRSRRQMSEREMCGNSLTDEGMTPLGGCVIYCRLPSSYWPLFFMAVITGRMHGHMTPLEMYVDAHTFNLLECVLSHREDGQGTMHVSYIVCMYICVNVCMFICMYNCIYETTNRTMNFIFVSCKIKCKIKIKKYIYLFYLTYIFVYIYFI